MRQTWFVVTLIELLYITVALLHRFAGGGGGTAGVKVPSIVRVALPLGAIGTGPVQTHAPGWVAGTGHEPPAGVKVHPLPKNSPIRLISSVI